jgi:hypothetical protein
VLQVVASHEGEVYRCIGFGVAITQGMVTLDMEKIVQL